MYSSFTRRAVYFLVPFTLVYLLIHLLFEHTIAESTQSGLGWYYSVEGLIFGLIAAFVIQRQWERWTSLSEAVRIELDAVREMWKWSWYAAQPLRLNAHDHLQRYLTLIVAEWNDGREHYRSASVDTELDGLRDMLVAMSTSMSGLGRQLENSFTDLVAARNKRLNYSNEHMPGVLKRLVIATDVLLILLSLFLSVDNIYLDYLFTAGIGMLAFAIIIVIDDLDNPFRPGAWHLTSKGYEDLLRELVAQPGQFVQPDEPKQVRRPERSPRGRAVVARG
jgi:hypothetical protein